MNMSNEKLMRLAERAMKRAESYQWNRESDVPDEENYKIQYLLVKGRKNSPENAVAYATYESEMMILYPLQENRQPLELSDDFFGFDSDLFEYLEQGYSVAFMSLESHCCIWNEIGDLQEDLEHQAGMQKYLHFCKQHGITKEQLAKEGEYDGMDVMKFYDRQAARGSQAKKKQEFER